MAIFIIGFLHLLGFINAYVRQSDHFTDLIYALSFTIIGGYGVFLHPDPGIFHWALFVMVSLWSIRLGIYLAYRIRIWGKDNRFDSFRGSLIGLMRFWLLQFFSILIIALPILFSIEEPIVAMGFWQGLGVVIFVSGLIIETVADYQKFVFKQKKENAGTFISSGLWKYSRHPNYLGEWMVWIGIFLYCMPVLSGIQWLALLSPAWMFILLRFISGGNLLEESGKSKYGNLPEYQSYIEKTGVFFPKVSL